MIRGQLSTPSVANSIGWLIFLCSLIGLLAAPVSAQSGTDSTGTGGIHVIAGRIFFPSGQRSDSSLQVKLEGSNSGGLSVSSDSNGYFKFTSLAPGSYTVVVDGGDKYETARETVYIDSDVPTPPGVPVISFTRNYTVNVELRPKRSVVNPSKTGVVDASLSAVPEAARKLYSQAQSSVRANDHAAAVDQLLGAISLDPDFALAYDELGLQYLELNQIDKAVPALRTAVKLNPNAFSPHLNLGRALMMSHHPAEAEIELRQAQLKNDSDWSVHLYLGVVDIDLKRYTEAERELRRSLELGGKNLSLPHYYLGGIYWQAGDLRRAADELEQYLQLNPKAGDAEQIRRTIKELREKST